MSTFGLVEKCPKLLNLVNCCRKLWLCAWLGT